MKYIFLLFLCVSFANKSYANTIKTTNLKALDLIHTYQYAQSYDTLKEAYSKKEYDNETLFLLAQTSKELGKFEESIQYFQELIANGGDTGHTRYELALTYMNNGEYDKARKELKLQKKKSPQQKNSKTSNLHSIKQNLGDSLQM